MKILLKPLSLRCFKNFKFSYFLYFSLYCNLDLFDVSKYIVLICGQNTIIYSSFDEVKINSFIHPNFILDLYNVLIQTKVGNQKIKGSKMKKVLGTAVLATVLGVTSLYAAISSKDALSIAEKNFPGSSVKDISVDVKKGTTFYKIESFKDGVKQEIKIDANSGQIVKQEMEKEKFILPNEAIDFSKFALNIDEAVAKALALEAGWSLDGAELDNKNGFWVYEIELDRGMSEKKVIINAQTGEIIGNYTK